MLSPKLLEILRSYWCVARPKLWLFSGDQPDQPITPGTIELVCQKTRQLGDDDFHVRLGRVRNQGRGANRPFIGRVMGAYTWASASEFNFFPRATVLALDHGRLLDGGQG